MGNPEKAKNMKITFIIPGASLSGGIRVVFEYANRLQEKGHDVTLVYPLRMEPAPKEWFKDCIRLMFIKPKVDWFEIKAKVKLAPSLSGKYIPDADVVIATWWKTAQWVNTFSKKKGEKFYLVQSYEIWSGPREKVDETYRMPLKKIVIASWLKNLMERKFSQRAHGPIINGVNFEQFYNKNKIHNKHKRVGMMYSSMNLKGSGDGIRAFEIAKKKYTDIELVMFGRSWPGLEVPEDVEFYYDPSQNDLRKIYSSCDIWMCPSWVEGCQLPPMEAMACKCALVATNVGGIPDYTIPGETALVSPPREPEALAKKLIRLLEDEELLKHISEAGYKKIKEFTWERATEQLEKVLYQEIAEGKNE